MQKHPQAFPKTYRLTKTDEYSSVFSFRKAVKSQHFLLHYRIPNSDEKQTARLGLIVAKRLLKRAVDRNLIRRLAREEFRLIHDKLFARDYILRLHTRPDSLDKRSIAAQIRSLLNKMVSP